MGRSEEPIATPLCCLYYSLSNKKKDLVMVTVNISTKQEISDKVYNELSRAGSRSGI